MILLVENRAWKQKRTRNVDTESGRERASYLFDSRCRPSAYDKHTAKATSPCNEMTGSWQQQRANCKHTEKKKTYLDDTRSHRLSVLLSSSAAASPIVKRVVLAARPAHDNPWIRYLKARDGMIVSGSWKYMTLPN